MEYKKLIDKHFNDVVKGLDEKNLEDYNLWHSYVNSLEIKQKATYLASILDGQVFNGGFHQYFLNSYGTFANLTLEILEKMNSIKLYKILSKVINEVNYLKLNIEDFNKIIFNRNLDKLVNFDDDLYDSLDKYDDLYYQLRDDLINDLGKFIS
ncbi:DMP19 family protein [Tenacibaculum agarivorans]|uniref:DMP19 family protein n=1 Tax=Tenacibaculum agarivorans TaxID=1908389 RepID=UPI00094B8952|nr:DUF4375 domain-containing protein [Tenacibaculum agarivorans]